MTIRAVVGCFFILLLNTRILSAQAPVRPYFRENPYRDIRNMQFLSGSETLVFNSAKSSRVYSLDIKTQRLQVLENLPSKPKFLSQHKDLLLMSSEGHITVRNVKTGKNGLSKDYASNAISEEGVINSMLDNEVSMSTDGKYFLAARDFGDGFFYVPFDLVSGLKTVDRKKYFFKHRTYTEREWGNSALPYVLRDESNHSAFNSASGDLALRTGFQELTVFDNLDQMKKVAKINTANKLLGESEIIQRFCYSGDGTRLVGVSTKGTILIWDATDNYKLISEARGIDWDLQEIAVDKKGRRLICRSGSIYVWDLDNKKLIGEIKEEKPIQALAFSPSGDLLAYATEAEIKIVDVPGLHLLQQINDFTPEELPANALTFAMPSHNGKYLYVGFPGGLRVLNLSTLQLEAWVLDHKQKKEGFSDWKDLMIGSNSITDAELHLLNDESGRYLLINLSSLVDLENGAREIPFEWTNPNQKVTNTGIGAYRLALKCAKFNAPIFYGRAVKYLTPPPVLLDDFRKVEPATIWWETQAGVDSKGNKYQYDKRAKNFMINDQSIPIKFNAIYSQTALNKALYSPSTDGNYVWISNDSRIECWDTRTRQRILQVIQTKDGFLLLNEDGYYAGPRTVSARMAFERVGQLLPADQFDYFFNRPDLVLEKLGFTEANSSLALYRKVVKKRLAKAGISSASIAAGPSVELRNSKDIPFVVSSDSVFLEIESQDLTESLATFQLWVNNIPVLGRAGKSLIGKNARFQIGVLLAAGTNFVEFSATNTKGVESERLVLTLLNRKKTGKGNLYVIGTGCSSYKDAAFRLNYAAKDARDLGQFFKNAQQTFDSIHVLNILDSELTRESLPKIRQWVARSKPEDYVLLFFAGHGVLNDALDYYLAPWDMDFLNPSARGIAFSDFEAILDDVPARRRILLVDACHSGEIDKDDWTGNTNVTGGENVKIRGFVKGKKGSAKGETFKIMSELFSNYSKGNGAFTLTAAGGAEFSWELGELKNGIFTHSLLEGLRSRFADLDENGSIDLDEWTRYTASQVSALSNNQQNPTIRNNNIYFKPIIWKYSILSTNPAQGNSGQISANPVQLYTILHDPLTPNRCFENSAGHWMADDVFIGTYNRYPSDNGIIEHSETTKYSSTGLDYNLFQWPEAMQYKKIEQARGVCPVGWHVPSKAEWTSLDIACEQDNTCVLAKAFPVSDAPYWTSSTENGLPVLRTGPKRFDIGNPEDKALVKCKKD